MHQSPSYFSVKSVPGSDVRAVAQLLLAVLAVTFVTSVFLFL